jgi:hypothetical protein
MSRVSVSVWGGPSARLAAGLGISGSSGAVYPALDFNASVLGLQITTDSRFGGDVDTFVRISPAFFVTHGGGASERLLAAGGGLELRAGVSPRRSSLLVGGHVTAGAVAVDRGTGSQPAGFRLSAGIDIGMGSALANWSIGPSYAYTDGDHQVMLGLSGTVDLLGIVQGLAGAVFF